jgi:uncharacterized protein (TIGR02246 family)
MKTPDRPNAAVDVDDAPDPFPAFVGELQDALDHADADLFNRSFADDVLWGSPFGLVVESYDTLHEIHAGMLRRAGPSALRSRYTIEHTRRLADDVALAFVRRQSEHAASTEAEPGRADTFDELALFVLTRRDDRWWLAAGLHVPDRRDVYR